MRPMYLFYLWQPIQIKEASEDMDVISKNARIQDDIIKHTLTTVRTLFSIQYLYYNLKVFEYFYFHSLGENSRGVWRYK